MVDTKRESIMYDHDNAQPENARPIIQVHVVHGLLSR